MIKTRWKEVCTHTQETKKPPLLLGAVVSIYHVLHQGNPAGITSCGIFLR
jgi:hypothetical protein